MAKKPGALTPGKGGGKGGKGGAPAVHHHHPHHHHHHPHHHPPSLGGPLTPGGGGTGGPAHRPHAKPPKAKHHPKARHHPKAKHHPKRKLAGVPLDGGWILGGNDDLDDCAIVAAANSLLLSSGLRTGDGELARLHGRAGPLSIPEALTALGAASFTEVQPGGPVPWPAVAGLSTPHGPHAALLLPGGALVTWGGLLALPDDWDLEEAWAVTW
jgi:hypothetical protein